MPGKPNFTSVTIDGSDVTSRDYRARLDAGIGYLPAGRLEEGLVEGLSITEHLALADRHASGFFVDWRSATATAARANTTSTRTRGPTTSTWRSSRPTSAPIA